MRRSGSKTSIPISRRSSERKRDELRREYKRSDLVRGVRGKYYKSYQYGTNLVLLSPDVAEVFSGADAVNEALRKLIKAAHQSISHETLRPMLKHAVELHREKGFLGPASLRVPDVWIGVPGTPYLILDSPPKLKGNSLTSWPEYPRQVTNGVPSTTNFLPEFLGSILTLFAGQDLKSWRVYSIAASISERI